VGLDDIQLAIPYSGKLGEIVDHVRTRFGNFRRLLALRSLSSTRGVSRLSEIGRSGGTGYVPGAADQLSGHNCRA
jgi:hypothetical protein